MLKQRIRHAFASALVASLALACKARVPQASTAKSETLAASIVCADDDVLESQKLDIGIRTGTLVRQSPANQSLMSRIAEAAANPNGTTTFVNQGLRAQRLFFDVFGPYLRLVTGWSDLTMVPTGSAACTCRLMSSKTFQTLIPATASDALVPVAILGRDPSCSEAKPGFATYLAVNTWSLDSDDMTIDQFLANRRLTFVSSPNVVTPAWNVLLARQAAAQIPTFAYLRNNNLEDALDRIVIEHPLVGTPTVAGGSALMTVVTHAQMLWYADLKPGVATRRLRFLPMGRANGAILACQGEAAADLGNKGFPIVDERGRTEISEERSQLTSTNLQNIEALRPSIENGFEWERCVVP